MKGGVIKKEVKRKDQNCSQRLAGDEKTGRARFGASPSHTHRGLD